MAIDLTDDQQPASTEAIERQELSRIAGAVTVQAAQWHADGLREEALLGLLHHCEPLIDEDAVQGLAPLVYRTHAYALAALLLLHHDRLSGDLATRLVELLEA